MDSSPARGHVGPRSTLLWLLKLVYKKDYSLFNLTRDLQRIFGDVVRIKIPFSVSVLIISDPDVIARVLIGSEKIATKGMVNQRLKIFLGEGLFTAVGDKWRFKRRIVNPTFHPSQMERIVSVIAEEARKLGDRWEKDLGHTDIVDLSDEMTRLTFSIISRAMFSTDLSETAESLKEVIVDIQELANIFYFAPFLLPLWLPTPFNRRVRKGIELINAITYKLIEEHRSQPELYKDMLSVLLNSRDPDTGQVLTDLQIRDEVVTMLLAGHETTATALAMGLEALSHEPAVVKKMRENHQKESAKEPVSTRKSSYMSQVCLEILRLYPSIWGTDRIMLEDITVKDYQLKKGDNLVLMQYLMHRHSKYWNRPDTFDPDRFSPENSAKRHPFAFFPFGGGGRSCIGAEIAKAEIEIIIGHLFSRFDLIPIEGFHYLPAPRVTMTPVPSIRLRVAKRLPTE